MKKIMLILTALTMAACANAQWYRTAYWNSDAYVDGAPISVSNGAIRVNWTGYVTNYTPGRSFWRIKVWNNYGQVVHNETFAAYGSSTNYQKVIYVPSYQWHTVELYAVSNQYTNTPNPSTHVCTYLWISQY